MSTTTQTDPVDAIQDLLDGAPTSTWGTTQDPDVFRWDEVAQTERGPGQGQPPHLYVWQPTGGPIERFSADGVLLWEPDSPVEVWAYSLDEIDTKTLAQDVINFIDDYLDDQEENTPFVDIQPTMVEDFREQKVTRRTDHYVYRVEIMLESFRDV